MKILVLNWRDIRNPTAGGAEVLTHEIEKRWVSWGHQVTHFSSSYQNLPQSEIIDGVTFIRRGHPDARSFPFSVHIEAFLHYRVNHGKYDVVIDEIHGLPFFTPWYVKGKRLALICEVANEIWNRMFPFPYSTVGRAVEKFYLSNIYSHDLFLTISNSTKSDLIKEGVKSDQIAILPMGLSVPKGVRAVPKNKLITIIYVGRLAKSKGIEDAIKSFNIFNNLYPKSQFWIVGRGDNGYTQVLKRTVDELHLSEHVSFLGFVEEKEKFRLMSKSHILLAPSIKEGWGLIVPEAGFVGTPSIVYNTHGLRDVVRNRYDGIITSGNNPNHLANSMLQLIKDNKLYEKIRHNVLKKSHSYSWDNTARAALEIIKSL